MAKQVKNQSISILWLKCWVPFVGVLGDFVVLGGLGSYPLQQIFWWPSDIYRNGVCKKNCTEIVGFHAKMSWFVFVSWWNSCVLTYWQKRYKKFCCVTRSNNILVDLQFYSIDVSAYFLKKNKVNVQNNL